MRSIIIILILIFNYHSNAAVVVFDQGHGQQFFIEGQSTLDLNNLAQLFRDSGYQVISTSAPLDTQLQNADVYVISGAFKDFDTYESKVLFDFINQGGNVAIMLHVGPLNGRLLERLGVMVSNGIVHDPGAALDDSGQQFMVGNLPHHPIFHGLDNFNMYGAWALKNKTEEHQLIASTTESSWVDVTRSKQSKNNPSGSFGVVLSGTIGQGKLIVFGDDAMFQNRFLTGNNLKLAYNLINWLTPVKNKMVKQGVVKELKRVTLMAQ